ncbi:MAG: amidohydrolase family protein [Alphaproteobacteria bacterium]|nr:amidohydrolase family protein [Alphaproteobacteria bacterium]
MKKSLLLATVGAISLLTSPVVAADLHDDAPILLTGFTRLDPVAQTRTDNSYLIMQGEVIIEMGEGAPPAGEYASTHDLSGLYALPGFIDAHGHIVAGPHAIDVIDDRPTVTIESDPEITQYHALTALAFGVTTVRNPGGDPAAGADYDQRIASGEWIGPETLHAGAVVQPPPFGGNAFVYPTSEEEWQAEAARQAELGMTYFKLYQSLTEEELATGIRVAHEHGMQAIAHLDAVSWQAAAELGIDGLLHALPTSADLLEPGAREAYLAARGPDARFTYQWFEYVDLEGPLIQQLATTLSERQIEVDLTLLVNVLGYDRDPGSIGFPESDRHYYHPATVAGALNFFALSGASWSDEDYVRAEAALARVLEFAYRLYEADVPLMIGTDGNGGGPLYAEELKLHEEAGIPPWEVLRLATSGNAQGMGLGDVTGQLAAGYEADIVFLNADPTLDLSRARDVAYVVNNGAVYTFEELTAHTLPNRQSN